mmetsp:Transcript_161341/g.309912  ORF Transcript_161341/g.309912 Transcript_161341/m.309912 type:complete len:348 (+) Transcript_161341:483-1526(+)
MLPHQLQGSSEKGRSRFLQIVVIQLVLEGAEEAAARQVASLQQHGIADVVPVAVTGLHDAVIFRRFFSTGRKRSPKRLQLVGEEASRKHSPKVDDLAGLFGLDNASKKTEFRMHAATNTLGMITALDHCPSTYCVFMDPDIFVHKPQKAAGWVDAAVALMEADESLAVLQAPWMKEENRAGCQIINRVREFSQRYFLVNRQRLQRSLPVKVVCAPDCDTFEAMFLMQKANAGLMSCSQDSSWVIHPPDDKTAFLRLLQSCAAHPVQPPAPTLPSLSSSSNSTDRRQMQIWIGEDHSSLSIGTKLERAAREGLPRFLDRVAEEALGHTHLSNENEGQDVSSSLAGWLC